MIVAIDLLIFTVVLVTAIFALRVKDLLTAVALLAGYSLFVALLFTGMLALDVALVEAALGAGLTGVLFIAAIMVTTRESTASESTHHRRLVLGLVGGFLGLMLYASLGLPDRGDPDAPAATGVSVAYLEGSLRETETPNVVTAVLADYRSQDTLGETLVILTAALSAALVMVRRDDEPELEPLADPDAPGADPDDAARRGPLGAGEDSRSDPDAGGGR